MNNHAIIRKIDALKSLQQSTSFTGEADAATLAIHRLEARLPHAAGVQRVGLLGSWQRTAWLLLLSRQKWNHREHDFLESMRCLRSAPSARQQSWLQALHAKAEGARRNG